MATRGIMEVETYEAGQDLSAKQFHFVTMASDGQVDATGDGARATGVLLNKPAAAGRAAAVCKSGRVTVYAGATVTRGGAVASDAAGKAVNAATNDIIMGYATEAGASGQLITIDLIQGGNASA